MTFGLSRRASVRSSKSSSACLVISHLEICMLCTPEPLCGQVAQTMSADLLGRVTDEHC